MKQGSTSGSILLPLLFLILLLSSLLFLLLQSTVFQKRTTQSLISEERARLAAESGLAVAVNQLTIATKDNPSFLVGLTTNTPERTPVVLIGATNLTSSNHLTPMISGGDLLSHEKSVDLNKHQVIAKEGIYSAPWVTMTNATGHAVGRYAYIFLDEQARLNPMLHQGKPRNDPDNWNQGVATLPLSLENNDALLTKEENQRAHDFCSHFSTIQNIISWESLFNTEEDYDQKKIFLTTDTTAIPDLIPSSLPEAGNPKYNLNDLATNPIYGNTPSDRAVTIATIIDRNLPLFKERDPSLLNSGSENQRRYLNRLAACIVDYIDPQGAPILINGGEPAGRGFFPLVTQTAERCRVRELTSNSVTIENQYFVQVWNPYTKAISAGSKATFSLSNRECLHFGTAPILPFADYRETLFSTPRIEPNQSIVLAFPTVSQTWTSPTAVSDKEFPFWNRAPEGNANPTEHQAFTFFWNDQLADMSRRPPIAPGIANGGLDHNEETLTNAENFWQCNFIPTEQDQSGHFRFVGDPRENYLSNYLWKALSGEKSYTAETQWQGVLSDASTERVFNPAVTWAERDFIPINPRTGKRPSSLTQTPDQISSSYNEGVDGINAPFVLRNAPMNSIVELGNINDPAQADDLGRAPLAGSSNGKRSIYASGGGRTLSIGQPEFPYWDTPGKRAIELLDLFSVTSTNDLSTSIIKSSIHGTNQETIYRKGLINVNTAPHAVLMALFEGIMPTSDHRFTQSKISTSTADELATLIEKNRPYEKLSDLEILTSLLANASTYDPPLSYNVTNKGKSLAAVFDRAREEAFGKMINLCTVQSRAFRVYILGESLDAFGKPEGKAMIEATLSLQPDHSGNSNHKNNDKSFLSMLRPVVEKKQWL